jgi:hypothetical protein
MYKYLVNIFGHQLSREIIRNIDNQLLIILGGGFGLTLEYLSHFTIFF